MSYFVLQNNDDPHSRESAAGQLRRELGCRDLDRPEDVDDFLADERPGAFERIVDRLLASPHFGERWGRRWLDLARYADSDGYEDDRSRPDAWRFRDWVRSARCAAISPWTRKACLRIPVVAGETIIAATLEPGRIRV